MPSGTPTIGPIVIPTPNLKLPTQTPIPTFTLEPIPTLTSEQEANLVTTMLESNGGCELPCWWGIIAGKTTYKGALALFTSLGISLGNAGLTLDTPHPKHTFDYRLNVGLDDTGSVIQSIKAVGEVYNSLTYEGQLSARFTHDWQRYAWSQILAEYGPPSQVRINLSSTNYSTPASYKLILFYESLGMAIQYDGLAKDIDVQRVRACPRFENITGIHVTLISPKQSKALLDTALPPDPLLQNTTGVRVIDLWPSLENATGMNVQTFYKTFKDVKSQGCLEELPTTAP